MKKKKPEFVKFSTIKNYIKESQKFRSSNDGVEYLTETITEITLAILNQAKIYSNEDSRKTIMLEDIKKAKKKVIGKKYLKWKDIFEHIKALTPAGIGNLTAAMENYIRESE